MEGLNYAHPSLSLFPVYNFPLAPDTGTCPAIQIHGVWFRVNPVHTSADKAHIAAAEQIQHLKAENASLLLQIADLRAQLAQTKTELQLRTPLAREESSHTEKKTEMALPTEAALPAPLPPAPANASPKTHPDNHVESPSAGNSPTKSKEKPNGARKNSGSSTAAAVASPVISQRSRVESVITLELPVATLAHATPVSPRRPASLTSTPRSPRLTETTYSADHSPQKARADNDEETDFDWRQAPGPGFGEIWKADYNFTGADANEPSFVTGDVLSIINKIDDNWWVAMIVRTGEFGLVPANHLSVSTHQNNS